MKFHVPIALALVAAGCAAPKPAAPPAPSAEEVQRAKVERGRYLTIVGGCNDCHTPMKMGPNGPEPDMTRMLSGHPAEMAMGPAPKFDGGWLWAGAATNTAFAGPWGISYSVNLTPDQETGAGIYTEASFIQALKTGKHMGVGRPILPPMPWPSTAQMKDDDLAAIFAYLQTVPPIRNKVPEAVIAAH